MSAEAKKPEEEIVPEVVEEVVEPQPSAEEQRAMSDGWMPVDKWVAAGNSEKDHRSAREFNDRGELLRKISEQNRYIQRVNQGVDSLKVHHARVFEAAHRKAMEDLKKQHTAAVEDGKIDVADRIVDQIADEKAKFASQVTAAQVQAQQPAGPSPELLDWKSRNRWYDEDEDMRTFADAVGFKYAAQLQGQVTPEEILAHVEKKVRDKFMKPEPKKEAAPSPVAGVQNTKQKVDQKGPKLKKADLSDDELKGLRGWVDLKMGTEAEYLAELEKIR